MALIVKLQITRTDGSLQDIDELIIRRTEDLRGEHEVHRYLVMSTETMGTEKVFHKYSDGAWELVRAAIEELGC